MAIVLMIVILLLTIVDHSIHRLETTWSVPDYYFSNKILFGFIWGIVGILLAGKLKNIWLMALTVSGVVATALQIKYFLEGYPMNFVLLFLLIHFLILYPLSVIMFIAFNRYIKINK